MDARFKVRRHELLDECTVAPQVFRDVMPRLERFMESFVAKLVRQEQRQHTMTVVRGLLSDLDRKNVESIAYRFGQDRVGLQRFVGMANWDDQSLRKELVEQVSRKLGDAEGIIVFDPSAFPKAGKESVGVARQWCGRLGKIDNCQVGIYMGYVSRHEHALVDMRLFLPKEWTKDKRRREKAGVPKSIRYRTRHKLCLEMLAEHGQQLPHAWVTGDDEMGRVYSFRRNLQTLGEQYLLAVPSNTLIRDMEVPKPKYCGTGRRANRPWQRADHWARETRKGAWKEIDVRDGAKGPLKVQVIARRVLARAAQRQEGHEEVLVVIRYRDRENNRLLKQDYYLSNTSLETLPEEFARVAKAEHRIEECIQRCKSEAGLADYEVRTWRGWHHHQTLSLIATWFLVSEARRGKKMDTGNHLTTSPRRHISDPPRILPVWNDQPYSSRTRETINTKRTRTPLSLETA